MIIQLLDRITGRIVRDLEQQMAEQAAEQAGFRRPRGIGASNHDIEPCPGEYEYPYLAPKG